MRISDWSSDVCSSDLARGAALAGRRGIRRQRCGKKNGKQRKPALFRARSRHNRSSRLRPIDTPKVYVHRSDTGYLKRKGAGRYPGGVSKNGSADEESRAQGASAPLVSPVLWGRTAREEIGRAACRESGCKYV